MSHGVQIRFRLGASVREDAEAGVHVAICPALEICTQAPGSDEAITALRMAANTYIELCWQRGILNDLLNRQGFVPVDDRVAVDFDSEIEHISVTPVPGYFELEVNTTLAQPRGVAPGVGAECLQ